MSEKISIGAQLQQFILNQIHSGAKKPGDRLPTEQELCDQFHVSRTTVIRALDNLEAQNIIIRRRGSGSYVAEPVSQARVESPNIISIIFPYSRVDNIQYINENLMLRGCEEYLKRKGYMLTVSYSSESFEDELEVMYHCKNGISKGAILYPSMKIDSLDRFYDIVLDEFPVVLIDNPKNAPYGTFVLSDNIQAGYLAANHLFDVGCDSLSFVTDIPFREHQTITDRHYGFCKSLKEHHQPVSDQNCFCIFDIMRNENLSQNEICRMILEEILSKPGQKHGVLCESDLQASAILTLAAERNVKVPEELSIIAFDGNATVPGLELTAIAQDFFKLGETAARAVYHMIKNPENTCRSSVKLLPVSLKKGSTT